jgi:hypothetical protein
MARKRANGKGTGAGKQAAPAKKGKAAQGRAVNVRMYKIELGDCFLLTFPRDGGGTFRMLIDCGLIHGAKNAPSKMKEVAKDIKEEVGKEGLDLVLITHEHWDHVSGFHDAREVFATIPFKQLWLAWTEDPTDELANKLRAGREARRKTLARAVQRLQAAGPTSPWVGIANELLGFAGGLAAAAQDGTAEALHWVKEHAGATNTRYCRPGELLELPGVSAVRLYVLGPPHDEKLIHQSSPSRRHPETYLGPAEEELRLLLGAAEVAGEGAPAQPFDEAFRLDRKKAEGEPFFQQHYGTDESWRRIDTDWQGLVGSLALQLDSATNNTSLALAVELLPSGQVLLFPGDAQVGNWLSWQGLSWPGPEGGARVTVKDLFARTVLYKVGHHGSHNATLREQGLELMTRDGLLAMIPVDEEFANKTKHWPMPWPDLLGRLKERTGGRILRADQGKETLPYAEVGERYIDVPVALGPGKARR